MLKVVLIGDSIREGYQPLVARMLSGKADVVGPEQNGGDSRRVLANLQAWLGDAVPDFVQVNCGLHDLRVMLPSGDHQVPVEEYRANVARILAHLKLLTPRARHVWASTTPVADERFVNRTDFVRREADVLRYNEAAAGAARSAGVEINDLHAVIERVGRPGAVNRDGTHMTELGERALADAVVGFILERKP